MVIVFIGMPICHFLRAAALHENCTQMALEKFHKGDLSKSTGSQSNLRLVIAPQIDRVNLPFTPHSCRGDKGEVKRRRLPSGWIDKGPTTIV